ncbi:MAG: isoprenyl transferase [Prevotella sp.]|nr:isoprenyl transferase [Prevotella sp.]
MSQRMNDVPQHIAIIMDGNGRWAQQRGQVRSAGHVAGVETTKEIIADCVRLGVKYLTIYAFSTENWGRPESEVSALMGLILTELKEELFVKNNVRMRWIGDRSRMPEQVRKHLEEMEEETKDFDAMVLTVAISYSARWELTDAVKRIAGEVKDGTLKPEDITEDVISQRLSTNYMPDPDLLIRTGGEVRISNYLLWQIAYTELYFTPVLWPDFRKEHLIEAIETYKTKQRRYGKI